MQCLVDVLVVLFLGKIIEPIWGSKEFLKFIAVVNASIGFCTFVLMFILYVFTRSEDILYAQLGGFHGMVAAFLVAIKQLMPEQELTLFGVFKFRAKVTALCCASTAWPAH